MRNIGISFLKIGQYTEAVRAFEEVMKTHGDSVTGMNLVVCYFALGESDAMRESFIKLIHCADAHQNDDDLDEDFTLEDKPVGKEEDELHVALKTKRSQARRIIQRAAKLIAPKIAQDVVQGYEFLIEQLRAAQLMDIAGEMEVSKAVHYLKCKELEKARDTLRELEKREEKEQDPATRSRAATNLAFISLLLDDVKGATEYVTPFHQCVFVTSCRYGNIAVRCDRYNARGLVNRGNVEFANALQARRKGSDRDFVDACEHALQLYVASPYFRKVRMTRAAGIKKPPMLSTTAARRCTTLPSSTATWAACLKPEASCKNI
jgi:intraflagellar transport protein 88